MVLFEADTRKIAKSLQTVDKNIKEMSLLQEQVIPTSSAGMNTNILPTSSNKNVISKRKQVASVWIDLTSGVIGGCSGIIVGQPFDTVKVRLQTHFTFYRGSLDCIKQTAQHEGFKGFFKGMTSPLVGNAWTNAIMFASYEKTLRMIDPDIHKPNLSSVFVAGAFGGFLQTFAVTPTDLIKCRLQVQDGHESNHYRGPVDCLKHVYQRHGIRGLYWGLAPTMFREVTSYAIYFSAYEYMKRKLIDMEYSPNAAMLSAGGIAGVLSWVSAYPMDVIKSSIQISPENSQPSQRTIVHQAKLLYRRGGYRPFFNGMGVTLVRAFPVNAVTFYFYEKSSEMMSECFLDN